MTWECLIFASGFLTFHGAWGNLQKGDDFWRLKGAIIDDVRAGRARLFVIGRHGDEGLAGSLRDVMTFQKFASSRGAQVGQSRGRKL